MSDDNLNQPLGKMLLEMLVIPFLKGKFILVIAFFFYRLRIKDRFENMYSIFFIHKQF